MPVGILDTSEELQPAPVENPDLVARPQAEHALQVARLVGRQRRLARGRVQIRDEETRQH
jgi:hypothetical protein